MGDRSEAARQVTHRRIAKLICGRMGRVASDSGSASSQISADTLA